MSSTSIAASTAPVEGLATSADGTPIAYTRRGDGPPVILVDGALCHRGNGPNTLLAEQLAARFTVFTYDRRGRGDSGDSQPYGPEREVDDIAALLDEAGGGAALYGISSGGALALDAASRLAGVTRVAAYEVPFVIDDSRAAPPTDMRARMQALVDGGRRGAAVRYFLHSAVGVPAIVTRLMGLMPVWSKLKAVAHTLPYDLAIIDAGGVQRIPADRWAGVSAPAVVITGGRSPAWMHAAGRAVAAAVPGAEPRTLPGQTHMVKPKVLAPVLVEFLAG